MKVRTSEQCDAKIGKVQGIRESELPGRNEVSVTAVSGRQSRCVLVSVLVVKFLYLLIASCVRFHTFFSCLFPSNVLGT